jgi:FtsP/CotA-like multicopper oxidase with cupredoxin domain
MRFFRASLPFVSVLAAGLAGLASAVTHDDNFRPDAVLVVTEEHVKQSCVDEKAVLLVNGTTPGPTLRFTEGETVWIRVYNEIHDQNLTMVRSITGPSCRPHHLFSSFIGCPHSCLRFENFGESTIHT